MDEEGEWAEGGGGPPPIRWAKFATYEWDSGDISMRAEGCWRSFA